MSKLPEGWIHVELNEVFSRLTRRNTENNKNVLTISAQHGLINQKVFFNKIVASDNTSNYFLLNHGDFAYNKSYSKGYPLGAVKRLERYSKGIVSPLYICFTSKSKDISTDFYSYYFNSGLFDSEINTIAQEGARNHGLLNIGIKDFFELLISLPPLAEQKKIAEILSSVDRSIEATEKLISKLSDLKKALMQELFTKGIGHSRFKNSPLGKIPEDWEVVRLSNFSRKEKNSFVNGPFGSDLLTSELTPTGIPVIYIRDIQEGQYKRISTACVTDKKAQCLSSFEVNKNDVIVAKVGDPPGNAALYMEDCSAIVTQDVIRIKTMENVYPYYLVSLLNSSLGIQQIRDIEISGTRRRFSLTDYKSLLLPMAPYKEQKQIGAIILSVTQKESKAKQRLEKLKDMKKALMQDLLTGKVRGI